ncbi:MAG: response regulator [Lachnospiraceae bacterium]|nr:response regulator [Lachnospiraceae bacterium]
MFKRKSGNDSLGNNLNYDVLQALARDYMIIVAVDAQSGEYNVIRCEPESVKVLERYIFANLSFKEIVDRYLEDHIYVEDRESVRNCFELDNIRNELSSRESFSMIVRKMDGDKIKYVRAEIRRYDPKSDKRFLLAVRDVDREVQLDQIRQNELSEAYKAAERASQAKNRFMYNMSHDIRSPLNAIMGYTTVANDNCEDPKMLKKCLGRIDDASHQVLSIISEILDLNELEEGVINITEHTLTMADLERQVMQTVQSQVRDKKLDFIIHNMDSVNPALIMDDAHMVRMLVNLIGHSSRFTEAGGNITLTITPSSSLDPEYRRYTFCVEDNGIGVSTENDSGVKIPIVKNILNALGGIMRIDTEEGKGSRFTIDLEFKLAAENAQEQPAAEEAAGDDVERRIAGKRILVVDDSQVSNDIAVTILSSFNAEVECAMDGSTAIDMICSNEVGYYDLILMDIEMPQMDGHETTREIRGLHRPDAKTLPIVALTANVFESTKREAYDAGMNGFLTKPIDVAELKDKLLEIFK